MLTPRQIIAARAVTGLTLREAAMHCGASHQTLHRLEKGQHVRLSAEALARLQQLFEGAGL